MPRQSLKPSLHHHHHHHTSSAGETMFPEPVFSFTIPSIHDDVILECRLYHPPSLTPNPRAPPWRKHAAVVAHPYAPLGGCYDDAVVGTLSTVLLKQGFVVGTFNFRGAGNSTGRTSWTSKAETSDYMSFAAFVYYYVHYLDPFRPPSSPSEPRRPGSARTAPTSVTPAVHAAGTDPRDAPVLLLCGYSYGAMITKLLPPFDAILEPFTAPKSASAAADIRLRAQHLAEKQNVILSSARATLTESATPSRKSASGLRVGGDEDKRRSQEHGRRSFSIDAEEKIRKGVADLMQRAKSHQPHHYKKKAEQEDASATAKDAEVDEQKEPDGLAPVVGLATPRVGYLLVSPPVGWATSLMTMNLGGFFGKRPKSPKTKNKAGETDPPEPADLATRQERQKLMDHPTLAIYGDSDVFVSVKRFREWASKLQSTPGSNFRAHEVSTAGHFYIEEGTMQRLAEAVMTFSAEVLAQGQTQPNGT